LPFKKQFFFLLKSIVKPDKKIYQHLHFKGVFKVDIDKKRNFKIMHHGYQIENEVFWEGLYNGWEKRSMRLWKKLCEDSLVIFDIGANTGLYSLVAQATNSESSIFAFEPVSRVFKKLKQNIELNGFDIICNEMAISDQTGKAKIFDTREEHTLSVAVNKDLDPNSGRTFPVEIDIITLDKFITQNKIDKIDLMKIDVETHEVEVLKGFKEHIHLFQPSMLIEILNEEVARGVEEIISGMDYVYYNIDEDSGIRKVEQLDKSDYYNFLICTPEIATKLNL
jgi:FkbM family methyltransferase